LEGLVFMQTGTVTRMFELRGFGFITPDQGDRDVFLGSEIINSSTIDLHEGQRVEFDAVETEPGLVVVSVQALSRS
jgi:CspA family cold shock protein